MHTLASGAGSLAAALLSADSDTSPAIALPVYPNVNPMLLADLNKDGIVSGADVALLQQQIVGVSTTLPPLPAGASGVPINGADPVLFVGTNYTPDEQPADLGSLTPGSTVLVPLSVFVTDPHGVNVTSAEIAFSFDPKVFTFDGVSAGAIASGSLGGKPYALTFAEVGPGEVNVVGSSSFGPNLAYGQTATLFWVSLTVRADAPLLATVFNLMSSESGLQTGLQDNQGRNLVLTPAPENLAGDNLDGTFTIYRGKPVQQLAENLSGTTTTGVKQAGSVTALTPVAWVQMTTLLFGNTANQPLLNGGNGGLAVAGSLPITAVAEEKKQADSGEALQGVPWKQLPTYLFEAAGSETDLNGSYHTQLS